MGFFLILFMLLVAYYMRKDTMILASNAFNQNEMIPKKYTCQGENISPGLKLPIMSDKAKTIALIMDDPDAPSGTFVHWVLYNMPAYNFEIDENFPKKEKLIDGTLQGKNDFDDIGYDGPCPPPGSTHRYYFKVYGVDKFLDLPAGATKKQLEAAMKGHIVEQAELIGLYRKS
ncbi:MAG: hypothetical protein A2Y25_02880 [Candidatus Melainabacteria bacterium GWF2_37_15]|nr:MAG: hypothetical protein A2Y25_02880 [Candidatus Melainabacteria bacterium GWF2_37_15]